MSSKVFEGQVFTRPNHFEGQVVKDVHLLTEQDYLDFIRMVNNYYIHQVSGVLTGLRADLKNGSTSVFQVAPGLGHYSDEKVAGIKFNIMQEVCLLQNAEFEVAGKINSDGNYKLIATTVPTGHENDAILQQYTHYMQQVVTIDVKPFDDVVTGLYLCKFSYNATTKTASILERANPIPKTVRSINSQVADSAGDIKITGNQLVQIINQATTEVINETHVSGITEIEFNNLKTVVTNLTNQVNELSKRIPRFKEHGKTI
jgi:hypothetical protein